MICERWASTIADAPAQAIGISRVSRTIKRRTNYGVPSGLWLWGGGLTWA